MEFSTNQFENIAVVVAAIVALSLTLSGALGPSIMLLTESLKSAFNVPSGKGGLVAVCVSVFVCMSLALITAILSVQNVEAREYVALLAIGAVVGVFVGSGAIGSHKASGTIDGDVPTGAFASAYNLGTTDTLKKELAEAKRKPPLIVNGAQPMTLEFTKTTDAHDEYEWNATDIDGVEYGMEYAPTDDPIEWGESKVERSSERSDDPEGDVAPPDVEHVAGLVAAVLAGPVADENRTEGCDITPNAIDDAPIQRA